jgi:hypothetical protein
MRGTKPSKYSQFEGAWLTVKEIRAMVPCLSPHCIRNHLEAGRNTRTAMLSFDHNAARRQGARNGSRKTRGSFVI